MTTRRTPDLRPDAVVLRCAACGDGQFQETNVEGRSFPYRDERALTLTQALLLPVCTVCGEVRESAQHAASLDRLLHAAYVARRAAQMRELVAQLTAAGWRQVDIEQTMALSAGYLSKVLRGEKLLAPSTFRHLIHLARHPRESLRDLAPFFPQSRDIESALERRGAFAASR